MEFAETRQAIADGRADEALAAAIHERFTYRMYDLGHTMKKQRSSDTARFGGGTLA